MLDSAGAVLSENLGVERYSDCQCNKCGKNTLKCACNGVGVSDVTKGQLGLFNVVVNFIRSRIGVG